VKGLREKEFVIEAYLNDKTEETTVLPTDNPKTGQKQFEEICHQVKAYFENEWQMANANYEKILSEHKRAIIGHEKEVAYFKDKIREYLRANHMLNKWKPEWYSDMIDGVYHELWGLSGLAQWFTDAFKGSSSAKVIGDKIFFMVDGKTLLMPQRINANRRKQLIKALLLNTPQKRLGDNYHEVYMLDGSRITIFSEDLVKPEQEVLVFRKFFVKEFTFEKQSSLGTIPKEAIPLFKSMIGIGYNVAFCGAVRTAKTTFLSTWQSYENPSLEGVIVETDPEIPLHHLMPMAPVVQLVADGEVLGSLTKSILRSDADYIIMAEARDGIALNIAVKAANKGTRRVKITFHTTDILDFCYDVADEIIRVYGGSLYSTMLKVARSFQYIFQFIQLQDKSQKRLKAIYNIRHEASKITIHQICKYDMKTDSWKWKYDIGERAKIIGEEENPEMFQVFCKELRCLSENFPLTEITEFSPYDHIKE